MGEGGGGGEGAGERGKSTSQLGGSTVKPIVGFAYHTVQIPCQSGDRDLNS